MRPFSYLVLMDFTTTCCVTWPCRYTQASLEVGAQAPHLYCTGERHKLPFRVVFERRCTHTLLCWWLWAGSKKQTAFWCEGHKYFTFKLFFFPPERFKPAPYTCVLDPLLYITATLSAWTHTELHSTAVQNTQDLSNNPAHRIFGAPVFREVRRTRRRSPKLCSSSFLQQLQYHQVFLCEPISEGEIMMALVNLPSLRCTAAGRRCNFQMQIFLCRRPIVNMRDKRSSKVGLYSLGLSTDNVQWVLIL